jgi:hypothetical protein
VTELGARTDLIPSHHSEPIEGYSYGSDCERSGIKDYGMNVHVASSVALQLLGTVTLPLRYTGDQVHVQVHRNLDSGWVLILNVLIHESFVLSLFLFQ